MAEQAPPQSLGMWRDWLFGKAPEGFKGTTGFKGGQLAKMDALNQLMMSMQGAGEAGNLAKLDVGKWETGAKGSANQSAINRGLFNTTVLDSTQRGIGSDAQRMRSDIDIGVQDRINAIRQAMASVLTNRPYGALPLDKPGFGDFFKQGLGSSLGNFLGSGGGFSWGGGK